MNFSKVSGASLNRAFSAPGDRNRESTSTRLNHIRLTQVSRGRTGIDFARHI